MAKLSLCAVILSLVCALVSAQVPSQVHVVYGGDTSSYVVSWVNLQTNGTRKSYVEYGYSENNLPTFATNTPSVFMEYRCFTDRIMHNVVLSPIKPNTRVYYRVSSGPGTPVSQVFNFYAIDRDNLNPSRPLVVSLTGDMAVSPIVQTSSVPMLANYSQNDKHDLMIHYGDIAYNIDDNCNAVGDHYMDEAQSVGAYTPYVYGVGNHETDRLYTYHSFVSRYAGQQALAAASGSDSVRWLSFDVQLVHFVLFDTDAWVYPLVMPLAAPQIAFLKKDLAKVNRKKTPWIVAIGHRAMYCTKNDDPECNTEAAHIRNGFPLVSEGVEPLFLEYGVDLYIAGHTHHYMRTWPVKRDNLTQTDYNNPQAPIHVQAGMGGVDGEDPFSLPMRPIDAWRDMTYTVGFSSIIIHNATHLTFNQHNATTDQIFDTFTIVQTNHGPFA